LPRALLLLGEGCEVEGDYEGAVAWFRRLITMFPALEEAARARVYSADCLAALGEDHYDEAEALLEEMLSGDYTPPDADVFRDAFLRLCDLLYTQGRYAEAIGRLETFQRLFPDDPDKPRVTFLWADAYRRSAAELTQQARDDSTGRVARESSERYRIAADLYDTFLRLVADEAETDEELAAYVRLALFNRGDCLLALNEPETLQEALETYQRAAAQYELEPSALSAQVLIAVTHLRLGQARDAARAVERARWMLRNIPEQTFAARGEGAGREFWDRYLTAVATSHLLRDVLPSAQ
jgi:tetratricopeptide (TPR) repeat protein